jgi:hypothetical protein
LIQLVTALPATPPMPSPPVKVETSMRRRQSNRARRMRLPVMRNDALAQPVRLGRPARS